MTDGNGESRPRTITAANVWEAFDRLRDESREARHSQNNLFQRAIADQNAFFQKAIADQAAGIRDEVGELDGRLRVIENTLSAAAPVTLGSRLNDLEMWRSKADGETTLVARINTLETAWDRATGSLAFLKVAATIVGLLNAAVLLWATVFRGQTP